MSKFKLFLLLVTLSLSSITMAQTSTSECPCCTEDYQKFDFWLGNWEVFNTKGDKVGSNTITKMYDNCVIQEKWVSKGPSRGTSYNYYDRSDKSWHQIWIDNTGYVLKLKGNFSDGRMILKSKLLDGKRGKFYNQISWFENNDGSVTQLWETFNEGNDKIGELFRGIYKKKLN